MKSIDEAGVKWHLSHPDADKEETWKAGANYVLDVVEKEIKRSFLEDYEEFSEEDRQIAQGVLGRINIWLKQFKGEII